MKFFTFIFIIFIAFYWRDTAGMDNSGKSKKLSENISRYSEVDKDHVESHTNIHESLSGSNFGGESSSSSTAIQFDGNQLKQLSENLKELLNTSKESIESGKQVVQSKLQTLQNKKHHNDAVLTEEVELLIMHHFQKLAKSANKLHQNCKLYMEMSKIDMDCILGAWQEYQEGVEQFKTELFGLNNPTAKHFHAYIVEYQEADDSLREYGEMVKRYRKVLKENEQTELFSILIMVMELSGTIINLEQNLYDGDDIARDLKNSFVKSAMSLKDRLRNNGMFDKLDLESEILDAAEIFHFRMGMGTFKNCQNIRNEDALIEWHNKFTKLAESLGIGLRRNMKLEIRMEKFNQLFGKSGESLCWVSTNTLTVIKLLLEEYYGLKLMTKDFLKVRGERHFYVDIGLFEFHFMPDGVGLQKFTESVDDVTQEDSLFKAKPIPGLGMIELEKAEKTFWTMAEHGWNNVNYLSTKRDCWTFVYDFVCHILDGKCPPKESWPKGFQNWDKKNKEGFTRNAPYFKLSEKSRPVVNGWHCAQKDFHLEIQVSNFQQMENALSSSIYDQFPVIHYRTGKFSYLNENSFLQLFETTFTLTADAFFSRLETKADQDQEKHFIAYEANVKAYECQRYVEKTRGKIDFEAHAFMKHIRFEIMKNVFTREYVDLTEIKCLMTVEKELKKCD